MKILITGGAGFIGSHLAQLMLGDGHEVEILDDFSNSTPANIEEFSDHKRLKVSRGDVRDYETVEKCVKRADVVFHLAAQIHVDRSIKEPVLTNDVNVNGTLNILNAARAADARVIYASSSEVYGTAVKQSIDEEHALNPASPYAASKVAADRYCFSYHNTYGLDVTIVRDFNTYGPRQKAVGYGSAIAIFTRLALENKPPVIYGDGEQTRDYIFVKDTVAAYGLVLESKRLAGEAINFGTGRDVSMNYIAGKIIELCGKSLTPVHVDPRPGEVRRLCANIEKARKIGFKPEYSIEQGLQEYVEYVKKQQKK